MEQCNADKIKQLVEKLNRYAFEYYTLDNPSISDKQYDELYDELVDLEQETGIILSNSPTQRVGDRILNGFEKVKHKNKLWSLDKSHSYDELKKFYNDVVIFCSKNNLPNPEFVVMQKFDGLTLKCEYDQQLIRTSSRGTGEIGEDLTEQSKTIVNLPLELPYSNTIHVHGEALMTKRAFEDYNKKVEIPLKNLRNGAAGALRNLNVSETAKRKLSIFFYGINYIENMEFDTYIEQLEFIKKLGLPIDGYKLCKKFGDIVQQIENIESIRNDLQYDIDGVVISVNDIKTREMMGYTIKFPRFSNAYKFKANEDTTTVLDVEFNTGRTGKITPRAIVEPIELGGVTVSYATLNNMDDINRKGVKIGSQVLIRRSGDVIPEILEAVDDEGVEIEMPSYCNVCGGKIIKNGVHYFCSNTLGCKAQMVKSIVHYCQREAMNVEGFSDKSAESFFENNIVTSIIDLYLLETKKEQIIDLPKYGLKKYNNLISSIDKSKKCKLSSFIFGLGIEGVGRKTSKDLGERFKTIDNLKNASILELLDVEDVGEITSNSIYQWFNNEKNIKLLNELLNHITFIEDEVTEEASKDTNNPLYNAKVYPTGKFVMKKEDLKKKLEDVGAIVESGYKKSLNYLLCGGDTSKSGKVDKAINDGVKLMSEDEVMKYLK